MRQAYVELNPNAIESNINAIKFQLDSDFKFVSDLVLEPQGNIASLTW